MATGFKVGAGKIEIKLSAGLPMAGYAARSGMATGNHDPLFARMVIFDCNMKQHALVVLDLLKVDRHLVALIRKEINSVTGILPNSITVAATHTHSGPSGIWDGYDNYNPALVTSMVATIANLAREVWAKRVPAKIGIKTGEVHNLGRNRNDPVGSYDPEVGVIRIDSLDGRALALIVNYACHPTVLGESNLLFSRDFPGYALDMIEKESPGGAPVAVFINGAAGDISTRYTRKEQTCEEAKRFGELLAEKVLSISKELASSSDWEIDFYNMELLLPVRRISRGSATKMLADAYRKLSDFEYAQADQGRIREAKTTVQAAEIVLNRLANEIYQDLPKNLPAEIQMIYLTGISTRAVLIVLPGEISSGISQQIKEIIHQVGGLEKKHIMILGYGNGYIGYLLSPDSYQELKYDSIMSKFDSEATELVVKAIRTLGLKGCEKNAGK